MLSRQMGAGRIESLLTRRISWRSGREEVKKAKEEGKKSFGVYTASTTSLFFQVNKREIEADLSSRC